MFNRSAIRDITDWYQRKDRKPLVIRGARQVGKTTSVRQAAADLDVPLAEINLEKHLTLEPLFRSYNLNELLLNFSFITGRQITPESNTILFLDEAQATPSAYACLRYFREEMPRLAVVLTGSLLDQVLHNEKLPVPVGRIEHYFMGSLSFEEFLAATDASKALDIIGMMTPETMHMIPDKVHEEMLSQVRRYILTGGMPYSVQTAITTDFHHEAILREQSALVQTYKDDFAKYVGRSDALKLNNFFTGLIGQVGQQFSAKQANEIALGTSGDGRQLKVALEQFLEARLFYRVQHSNADTIPLGSDVKTRISKLLFVDVGLLLAVQGVPVQSILSMPLELANRGIVAEQFVGQQLLYSKPGYLNPELYYWQPPKSESQAEIDYLFEQGSTIYPVEVKSAKGSSIKSIHAYIIKKQADTAFRISSSKPSIQELTAKISQKEKNFSLINLPFYMVNRLERFTRLLEQEGA